MAPFFSLHGNPFKGTWALRVGSPLRTSISQWKCSRDGADDEGGDGDNDEEEEECELYCVKMYVDLRFSSAS